MNVLEAIAAARDEDMVIRRPSWPEGRELFWKNGSIHINDAGKGIWEERLPLFTTDAVLAEDWEAQ